MENAGNRFVQLFKINLNNDTMMKSLHAEFRRIVGLFTAIVLFASCNTTTDELDVPSTYEFLRDGSSTVSYTGQMERLDMLAQMSTYMKSSNTLGSSSIDASVLNNMFGNVNDPFNGQIYAKNLRSKCFAPDTSMFQSWFDQLETASQSSQAASNGVAGVLVQGSSDPNTGYRVNELGIEPTQVIEKGLMGAVFFYQAMEVYLSTERMGATGNDQLVEGKNYTQMEHYFDEAFGYFGVPTNFPSGFSVEDARFWGKYCNTRNNGLYSGINDEISLAFRTARASIVAKDYEARDEAIQDIMHLWSKVIAASAVGYLTATLSAEGLPEYKRHHEMSEAIGFMLALKYHFNGGNSKYPPHYTYTTIELALQTIGPNTNLYDVTDADINTAIGLIREAFPSGEIK